MDTTELDEAKYVSLTTYKRDGSAVSLPIWIIGSGGSYEMTTEAESWKVKRIRNNPTVQLQVSDMRGKVDPGATVFAGTVDVVDGAESDRINREVYAKYGLMGKVLTAPMKLKRLVTRQPEPEHVGLKVSVTAVA